MSSDLSPTLNSGGK
uniref:Uncharacterized protein n=1 Tax=Colobus angolensis palliatus TaxID=336983 RepID=A0A2K5HV14_COLAP